MGFGGGVEAETVVMKRFAEQGAAVCAGELSFTWACFGAAMMSNLLFAARAVFSKKAMSGGNQVFAFRVSGFGFRV